MNEFTNRASTRRAAERFPHISVRSEQRGRSLTFGVRSTTIPPPYFTKTFEYLDLHENNVNKQTATFPVKITENILRISKAEEIGEQKVNETIPEALFPIVLKDDRQFPLTKNFMKLRGRDSLQSEAFTLRTPHLSSGFLTSSYQLNGDRKKEAICFPLNKSNVRTSNFPVKYSSDVMFSDDLEAMTALCEHDRNNRNTMVIPLNESTPTMTDIGRCHNFDASLSIFGLSGDESDGASTPSPLMKTYPEREQQQLTPPHKHSGNVLELATISSKNSANSGRMSVWEEWRNITDDTQNSRSATATQYSRQNMNEIQQQNSNKAMHTTSVSAQVIKIPASPSSHLITMTTTTITRAPPKSVNNIIQNKAEQMYAAATNAATDIPKGLSNINFEHQQAPWSTQLTHSDVRDPSSQKDLVVVDRVACEPSVARSRIESSSPPPATHRSAIADATTITPTTAASNKLPASLILSTTDPAVTDAIDASRTQNECQHFPIYRPTLKSAAHRFPNVSPELNGEAEVIDCVRRAEFAMTLTKVDEQNEEDNFSVSSYNLDDTQKSFIGEATIGEMKFEMNGAKSASNAVARSLSVSAQNKNETPMTTTAMSGSVLSAATNLSKLANFGQTRRDIGPLAPSALSASLDAKDSVLPARTLLRRQRRLSSQCSEDKQEDPIERLNRLKARISGALSEVKGVLKHYSVDEENEPKQRICSASKPSTSNDSSLAVNTPKGLSTHETRHCEAPVSFRFVRKIRRRSAFMDDDDSEAKAEASTGNTELTVASRAGERNNSTMPKEECEDGTKAMDVQSMSALNIVDSAISTLAPIEEIKEGGKVMDVQSISGIHHPIYKLGQKVNEIDCSGLGETVTDVTAAQLKSAVNLEQIAKSMFSNASANNSESTDPRVSHNVNKTVGNEISTVEEKGKNDECTTEIKSAGGKGTFTSRDKVTEHISKDFMITPKTRLAVRSKDANRRASIAAVEGSQIEAPVRTTISLSVKTQRRPSDSEAVRRKVKTSEADSNASMPKVRTVVKVKRPSLKKTANANQKNAAASAAEISESNNNAKDTTTPTNKAGNAIAAVNEEAPIEANKITVPTTSPTFSTQSAIAIAIDNDDASLKSARIPGDPKTEATQALSIATKNTTPTPTPTKLNGHNVAVVAPLVSTLRTGEASSQAINAKTHQPVDLLNHTKVVTPTPQKANDKYTDIATKSELCTASVSTTGAAAKTAKPTALSQLADPDANNQQSNEHKSTTTETALSASIESSAVKRQQLSVETNTNAAPISKSPRATNQVNDAVQLIPFASILDGSITGSTKVNAAVTAPISAEQNIRQEPQSEPFAGLQIQSSTESCSKTKMPELQVTPAPVKPVQVFAENDAVKGDFTAKKALVKRIVCQNSNDKDNDKRELATQITPISEEAKTTEGYENVIVDNQPNDDVIAETPEHAAEVETAGSETITEEEAAQLTLEVPAMPVAPKKPRKVKKKVIIKRQQRKLSVGETTFFKVPERTNASPEAIETLERAIAFVTDDEDEAIDPAPQPVKPLKTCLKQREYQVGDWVMYGERFRKTQIRWKKGQVIERITSISYKIDVDGKEVSAHINYIKKYTGRRVNFGGKEYLEIDYEQIAEEERKACAYSIWNMV